MCNNELVSEVLILLIIKLNVDAMIINTLKLAYCAAHVGSADVACVRPKSSTVCSIQNDVGGIF